MSLRKDADILLKALREIIRRTEAFAYKNKIKFLYEDARKLTPLVNQYESAIKASKSKELAKLSLSEMAPIVNSISMASSKGEMDIFDESNTALENYHELYTIFRESRYSNDSL